MSNRIKRREIGVEAKFARRQKEKRLSFDPLSSKDPYWEAKTSLISIWLNPEKSECILDLGAASCEPSEFIAACGCDVVALDLSREMLSISKDRLKQLSRIEPLHYVVADCEHMPFHKSTFDKCLCWESLHHLSDPGTTLEEVYRTLRNGGTLILAEPNRFDIFRRIVELRWHEGNIESSFYPPQLKRLLGKIGYNVTGINFIYESKMAYGPPWLRTSAEDRKISEVSPMKTLFPRTKIIIGHTLSQAARAGKLLLYFFGTILIKCKKSSTNL
jgi:ubiquinone/menaquinone biosynthesis C-methylase UbiE